MSKQKLFFMILISLFLTNTSLVIREAHAHHGSVSAAFGPGAPIETSSPITLPKGGWLLYEKVQYIPYKKFDRFEPDNIESYTFYNSLIGYGFTDYLSAYAVVPYAEKKMEKDGLGDSQGIGDLEILIQLGFKFGERDGIKDWYLFGPEDSEGKDETLDDWKLGLIGSFTIPSGVTSNMDDNGEVFGMAMQPGFGAPVFSLTGIVSKMVIPHLTLGADVVFRTFTQANEYKAANEYRANFAALYELFETKNAGISRVDLITEANYLHLGRDIRADRTLDPATGGHILYLSPGFRLTFFDRVSFGALIQFPTGLSLNRRREQQGAEGLEEYRLSTVLSMSF